jgi:hypothetical protein
MHGLRHVPGSNQVNVSFFGVFVLSFVIGQIKFAVKGRDITALSCFYYCFVLFPRIVSAAAITAYKGNHYFAKLGERKEILLWFRSFFQLFRSFLLRIVSV